MTQPARGARRGRRRSKPLLQPSDFRAYLTEKASQIAPRDLESLLARSADAREKAAREAEERPRVQRQVELALQLLSDHVAHQCPQVPYHTVCLLTVALLYFLSPLDVIPDLIPGVGSSDDALVVELAFQMAGAGVERYRLWKGLPLDA